MAFLRSASAVYSRAMRSNSFRVPGVAEILAYRLHSNSRERSEKLGNRLSIPSR